MVLVSLSVRDAFPRNVLELSMFLSSAQWDHGRAQPLDESTNNHGLVEKVLPAAIDFCSAASSLASATATASGSSATGSSATGSSVPSSAAATPTGSSTTGGSSATSTSASAQATDTGAAAALGGSIPVMVAAGLVALL